MRFQNIDAERARYGMSKVQLARTLNVSEKTLYNWEKTGQYTLAALRKMAEMFNCSIDYLVETKEETK